MTGYSTNRNGRRKIVNGTQGTGNDEWYTPLWVLDDVRAVLGAIELDPASNDIAQRHVRAERYYTVKDNALKRPWDAGTLFLNPPYSRAKIGRFIERLCVEVEDGNVASAVLLTHASTDTRWWQRAAHLSDVLILPRGRIRFVDKAGNLASPMRGQTLFYYGADVARCRQVFSPPRYRTLVRRSAAA